MTYSYIGAGNLIMLESTQQQPLILLDELNMFKLESIPKEAYRIQRDSRYVLVGEGVNQTAIIDLAKQVPGVFEAMNDVCRNTPFLISAAVTLENTGQRSFLAEWYDAKGICVDPLNGSLYNITDNKVPLVYLDVDRLTHRDLGKKELNQTVDWIVSKNFIFGNQVTGVAKLTESGLLCIVRETEGEWYLDKVLNGDSMSVSFSTIYIDHYLKERNIQVLEHLKASGLYFQSPAMVLMDVLENLGMPFDRSMVAITMGINSLQSKI